MEGWGFSNKNVSLKTNEKVDAKKEAWASAKWTSFLPSKNIFYVSQSDPSSIAAIKTVLQADRDSSMFWIFLLEGDQLEEKIFSIANHQIKKFSPRPQVY